MGREILERLMGTAAPPADVQLSYGPDRLQFGELRLPSGSGPHPVLVVIHGGYYRARYDLTHIGHACAALAARGAATWNVEYRRIGNPGGAWPGTFEDVAAAADHLRELAPQYNLDLNRVVAIGHSAGGHLALWLAARRRIRADSQLYTGNPLPLRAAVSLAGVVDLRLAWELALSDRVVGDLLGGSPEQFPQRYAATSPIELLPLGVPQTLLHGTEDESVPFFLSERYQERANELGDDARLVPLPGVGHFELIDPQSREFEQVLEAALVVKRL